MKKMSRKNFRGGPLFSSKSTHAPSSSSSSSASPNSGGGGIMRRATWADKIRDKLPPLGENEYEVLWERGVLGVVFLESEKDGIPYVSKATESCISPALSQGDILKYVNVVRSKDHSFSDFFKILATMKKPVLLRFERLAASTPSSDEDEAAQLFGVQRASSTNAVNNSASHYARQNAPTGDEADPTGKFQRANSVPQKDHKPPKATRGAFWRAPAGKDSVGPAGPPNPANAAPPDRLGSSQSQGPRRVPSGRDHQVSPRDAVAANGSGGHSASHSPLGLHEYQVYWETGSLGLFFGEDRSTNLPVVTRSTPSANPVVRRAVAVNDTLVSANGIRSADYTFESFFGRLQQMNKPVRLVFRRRQPTDQVVIVKQGDPQQHQRQQQQQQMQQQLQQRQQQMREQQQQREQQELREQQQQREQQQREQQQQEVREKQREQQLREQQLHEQQLREQQLREQQLREQQLREQQLREQQLHEKQQLQEQQRRQQEEAESRNRTPSATVDTTLPSVVSPAESRTPHRNRTPSPTVKRAGTPPPRPSSPQVE
ncbi:hypothetical protein PRIC1_001017 [Phytophthora ramorum]